MYVCKQCHDKDVDAIGCKYTFEIHEHITPSERGDCEICNSNTQIIFCAEYQAEILIRSIVKRNTQLRI